MKSKGWLIPGLLALALVSLLNPFPAFAADDDPIISLDSRSEMEIDLKMVVGDFLPQILEMTKAEDPMKAEWMELAVELFGVRALDRLHATSVVTKEEGLYRSTLTLDPEVEGGLLRAMLAVPDGTFRFGKYLREEDASMLLSLVNFSEGLRALYEMAMSPEVAALLPPVFTQDEEGSTTLFGINLEEDVFPLLNGELDFIMFPFLGENAGSQPPMAVVLGTSDGPALRAMIFKLLGQHMGEEMAAQFAEAPAEAVGEFSFYPLPEGAAYAVSDDFLVVTTQVDRMKSMLADPQGDLGRVKARQYLRMDTEMIFHLLANKMGEDAGPAETEIMTEMLAALDGETSGTIVGTTNAQPNRLDTELRQPGNLLSMEYRLFREIFALAPKMAALESNRDHYVGLVAELDQAFTRYGREHDGVFPADPTDLVEGGYLDVLPEMFPTPLGQYSKGSYTYLPLRDDSGTVVGYYFFLYGGGEGTGFDILTPDNITDPENFVPGRDGILDGVVSFCYDGIALEQIRKWNAAK